MAPVSDATDAPPVEASTNPQPRRWWSLPVLAGAWALVLGLLLVAALRIVAHDATLLLTCINSFTLYLYLPAYFTLVFALYLRSKWLALASLIVIAAHLAWVAPDFLAAATRTPAPPSNAAAPSLRVLYANINRDSESREEFLKEVAAADPDVIIFAEFWIPWQPTLVNSPLVEQYPYGTDLASWTRGDVVVRSRVPLENLQTAWSTGRVFLQFSVTLDGRPLHVFALHSPRPMNMIGHDYRGYWHDVLPAITQAPRPLVLIGDFNSTQHSRIYREITALGLHSVHESLGRGYVTTWPNGRVPIPPIRIDHAFASPEIECRRCEEGRGAGSDHRPLILEFAWRAK